MSIRIVFLKNLLTRISWKKCLDHTRKPYKILQNYQHQTIEARFTLPQTGLPSLYSYFLPHKMSGSYSFLSMHDRQVKTTVQMLPSYQPIKKETFLSNSYWRLGYHVTTELTDKPFIDLRTSDWLTLRCRHSLLAQPKSISLMMPLDMSMILAPLMSLKENHHILKLTVWTKNIFAMKVGSKRLTVTPIQFNHRHIITIICLYVYEFNIAFIL